MFRKLLTGTVLLAVAASGAFAQRGGGGGGRSGGGGGGFGGFGQSRTSKPDEIAKELKLNKDQKAELPMILDEARKQAQPVAEQIQQGRLAIVAAHIAGQPPDELVQKLAAADAQMLSIEASTLAKILAKMDEKQKAKANAAKAFEAMSGMFDTAGGPGGGRGRGGR